MTSTNYRLRYCALSPALAVLSMFGIAAAAPSSADDCDWNPASIGCMMNGDSDSDSDFSSPGFVQPIDGGIPELAIGSDTGGYVPTADGNMVLPVG